MSEGRGSLVFGDVWWSASHRSMFLRSYVWPSIAMTGSRINSMEIGQTSASGGSGRAACVAAGAGAATAGAGRGGGRPLEVVLNDLMCRNLMRAIPSPGGYGAAHRALFGHHSALSSVLSSVSASVSSAFEQPKAFVIYLQTLCVIPV